MKNFIFSSLPLPNKEDWGESLDDDLTFARNLFLGRSNDEIVPLLEHNFLMRALDLSLMPDPVFEYYVCGFSNYLACHVPDDEEFGVFLGCFLSVLNERRAYSAIKYRKFCQCILPALNSFCERVAKGNINSEAREELWAELSAIYVELGVPNNTCT